MGWLTGGVVYVLIWWLVIFTVLPIGVRPSGTNDQGHEPGAPTNPRLVFKAMLTTGISAVLWVIFYLIVTSDLISFRGYSPPT